MRHTLVLAIFILAAIANHDCGATAMGGTESEVREFVDLRNNAYDNEADETKFGVDINLKPKTLAKCLRWIGDNKLCIPKGGICGGPYSPKEMKELCCDNLECTRKIIANSVALYKCGGWE